MAQNENEVTLSRGFAGGGTGGRGRKPWHRDLELLWARTRGDERIRVAVLDGPVDRGHPSLENARLTVLGKPARRPRRTRSEALEHGTHVASILFGQHGAGPVLGVAPRCSGWIVPIFSDDANGRVQPATQQTLARAILTVLEHGVHVINVSGGQLLHPSEAHPELREAVRRCRDRGVLLVAAAGNDGCCCLHVPGALPSVLAVAAADDRERPLPSANWGGPYQTQGLLAPGEEILGALPGGGSIGRSGSSFATPVVSGVAALLLSLQLENGRPADPLAIRQALLASATPCDPSIQPACHRHLVGHLNPRAALTLIERSAARQLTMKGATFMSEVITSNPPPPDDLPPAGGWIDLSVPALAGSEVEGAGASADTLLAPAAIQPPGLSREALLAEPGSAVSPVFPLPGQPASLVMPAACGCGGNGSPQYAFPLGQIGYDFGTQANYDWFRANMSIPDPQNPKERKFLNPNDPKDVALYLQHYPENASAFLWTLNVSGVPVYSIRPFDCYCDHTYKLLRDFLGAQATEDNPLASVPGVVYGATTLQNGQGLPTIHPDPRGMYIWTIKKLVALAYADEVKEGEELAEEKTNPISNLLRLVYEKMQNLGTAPADRAINFAATQCMQVLKTIFQLIPNQELLSIQAAPAAFCRPGSDCWSVYTIFFNPKNQQAEAKTVFRFTVDVATVAPVLVGRLAWWKAP